MQDSVIPKISTSDGIGLFAGPMPPIITPAYLNWVALFSGLLALFIVPMAIGSAGATLDFLAVLCVLTTIGLPIIGLRLARRPVKPIKMIEANGIWLSKDIISWGKMTLEFEEERSLSDLYSAQKEPIRLVSKLALPTEGDTYIETQAATVTFQITHARDNKKHYRVVFVHISRDEKEIYSHNLTVGFHVPILIVGGKLFSLHNLKIADQLKKIADSLKAFPTGGTSFSNLLITPRTQISIGIPFAVGAIGGVIAQSLKDSIVETKLKNALQAGEFIDQETGKFLLELIQNYGWEIGYRPLSENELSALGNF